jgi:hypothetical protein
MTTAPTLFTTLQQRLSYRTRESWFRRVVERRKAAQATFWASKPAPI